MAETTSTVELFEAYPDAAAAKQFVRWRWPDGIACPRCRDTDVQEDTPHPNTPFRCRGCNRFFSVKTGTVMQSSKLGYRTWPIAMQRILTNPKEASSIQLHKDLGITQKSAWFLRTGFVNRGPTSIGRRGGLFAAAHRVVAKGIHPVFEIIGDRSDDIRGKVGHASFANS